MTGTLAVKRIGTRTVLRRYPIAPNRFADGNILNDFPIIFQIVVTFENFGDFVVKFLVFNQITAVRNIGAAAVISAFRVCQGIKIQSLVFKSLVDGIDGRLYFAHFLAGNAVNAFQNFHLGLFDFLNGFFQTAHLLFQFVAFGSGNVAL